jgi:prepilin-type N-terminal cleavage/methylation domain-containing protein
MEESGCMSDDRPQECGFTILEVLVALVILIMGLAGYYFAFGSGLLASASAERKWRAARAADNIVAQLGRSIPLDEGITTGEFPDGRRWRVQLTSADLFTQNGSVSPLVARVATVEISEAGGESEAFQVQTMVIGARPK